MKVAVRLSLLLFTLLTFLSGGFAQTFRGALSGTVTDVQGASLPAASVTLTNPATGYVLKIASSKTGEFSFPELPVGSYELTVGSDGFASRQIGPIEVMVTKVTTLNVVLSVGAASTVVNVTSSGVQTEPQSSALVNVIGSKAVQEMPMNGRDFTQMVKFIPGATATSVAVSVNGMRTSSINFQVDGADNIDGFTGVVASNQGGIAGVAGGLIPIEAINQFSMQSAGEADQGRNAGANSNMVLRSGTKPDPRRCLLLRPQRVLRGDLADSPGRRQERLPS